MLVVNMSRVLEDSYIVKPALCMDLDGTVWRDKDNHKSFINDVKNTELLPGVEERMKEFKQAGYLIFLVSNQGGVAHGFKSESDAINMWSDVFDHFEDGESLIDAVTHCPFEEKGKHVIFGFRSLLRKPQIGMLAMLETIYFSREDTVIDWNHSLMVGDRSDDSELAANASINFYHIDAFLNMPVDSIVAMVQADQK